MDEDKELLFFDTFASDGGEEPNLGLVQFPNPIVIDEIRVIPLGVRVEADFPGGVRLGATNPSKFVLEFFINDLTKREACTFYHIGRFEYKENVNIHFVPKEKVPTDGLILRGSYSTLTLAVFGSLADVLNIIPKDSPTSMPIPEPLQGDLSSADTSQSQNEGSILQITDIEELKSIFDEVKEDSLSKIKLESPPVLKAIDSRVSSSSSEGIKSDGRRPKRHRRTSKERSRKNRHSPSSLSPKMRSRSRSLTPSSKRPYYTHHSPVQFESRSPRRSRRSSHSPKKVDSRSMSPRSPYRRAISPKSSCSSGSLSRARYQSPVSVSTQSPVSVFETIKETKPDEKEVAIQSANECTSDLNEPLYDPLSPEHSLSDIAEKISDDDNFDDIIGQEDEILAPTKSGFEEISSEEEYEDDGGVCENDMLMDFSDYDIGEYTYIANFNPDQCEFTALQFFNDPSLFPYEIIESESTKDQENIKIIQLIDHLKVVDINDKWVESLELLAEEITLNIINKTDLVKKVVELAIDGLDFEKALQQSMTAFKVRHIKAGIKLFTSLACTNEDIIHWMIEMNLPQKLLSLYEKQSMTLPVKLMIIKGIDVLSDTPIGVEHLVNHVYNWKQEGGNEKYYQQTCYQKLLDLLMEKPLTRIIVAITALLRKIHFYEALGYLSKTLNCDNFDENEIDAIACCLIEVLNVYSNASNLIGQHPRRLPASSQFELKSTSYSYHAVYKYFKHFNIIELISNILSGQHSYSNYLFDFSLDILNQMTNINHGLSFLLSKGVVTTTNMQCKILLQHCDESVQHVGLKLIYRLHALQLIDMLNVLCSIRKEKSQPIEAAREHFNDNEVATTLHNLYSMLFSFIGRDALINVLSQSRYFDVILYFISPTGDSQRDFLMHKSVCASYAVELCLNIMQFNDTNLHFLETFGKLLLKLSENLHLPKLQILNSWLSPIKDCSFNSYNEMTFKHLMSFVKKHAEASSENKEAVTFTVSPELITAIRLLHQLCIPLKPNDSDSQLKYHYAIIQLYSFEGFAHLITILAKLSDVYLKPSHQSIALVGNRGAAVVALVKPSISLIKAMLAHLISTRGCEFKDVLPVPVLLRISLLLTMLPTSSFYLNLAQQLHYDICEILKMYTQLCLNGTETDEVFNKSVWTKMFKEVVDFTLSSPICFIHGLELLSELLPQPFPLVVKENLSQEEVMKAINFRKLWSAHLHLLNDDIEKIINNLTNSNVQIVQMLLRRIFIQLADLSAPSSLAIAKFFLEALYDSLENLRENEAFPEHAINLLNIICDILSHSPFKLAFINTIQSGSKKDEKCFQTFSKISNILSKSNQEKAQQIIKKIFHLLSDVESFSLSGTEFNFEMTSDSTLHAEKLNNYFTNRQIYSVISDQEDSQQNRQNFYSNLFKEADAQFFFASAKIDLFELSRQYFGTEFDIISNLEKIYRLQDLNDQKLCLQTKEGLEKKKHEPLIRSMGKDLQSINKRLVQRGRGRPFARSNDPFRSRPPNTSRPPSMHVDDFIAMENNDPNVKRVGKEFTRLRGPSTNSTARTTNSNLRQQTSYYSASSSYDRRSPSSIARSGGFFREQPANGRSNRMESNWTRVEKTNRYSVYSRSNFTR